MSEVQSLGQMGYSVTTGVYRGGEARQDARAPLGEGEQEFFQRSEWVVKMEQRVESEQPSDDDPQALEKAVQRMEEFIRRVGRDLHFRIDDETGHVVVTVLVRGTDDVVRQIPPEEMLAISKRMAEVHGLLFNSQA